MLATYLTVIFWRDEIAWFPRFCQHISRVTQIPLRHLVYGKTMWGGKKTFICGVHESTPKNKFIRVKDYNQRWFSSNKSLLTICWCSQSHNNNLTLKHILLIAIIYSLVPIRRHGSINRHTSFIWLCNFPKTWGVTIIWINTQFWSSSRGTFDKTT